jgi:hypothetical protein
MAAVPVMAARVDGVEEGNSTNRYVIKRKKKRNEADEKTEVFFGESHTALLRCHRR